MPVQHMKNSYELLQLFSYSIGQNPKHTRIARLGEAGILELQM